MKTRKGKINIDFSLNYKCAVVILLLTALTGCNKNNDESSFITAKVSTSMFEELNTCDIGSCCPATRFDFTITYEASSEVEIDNIIFDLKWSDGDLDNSVETIFSDSGTSIKYDWCYKFGIAEWVEITHKLVTKQGTISNSSIVRLHKPEGAN